MHIYRAHLICSTESLPYVLHMRQTTSELVLMEAQTLHTKNYFKIKDT